MASVTHSLPGLLIGNILSINLRGAWKDLTEYKSKYGDIVFFHGLGNKILALNSLSAINDLLEKRGSQYSHRPVFTVVGELMALGQSMPLLPYGQEWRQHRKLAHVALNPTATRKYHSVQEDLAALLNKALLDDPKNFFAHVRLTAGRIVLSVTYGLSVQDADDNYITHAEETMEMIGKATVPGAFLCDLIPFLKYAPSWVPFQREASRGREMIERLVSMPLEHVKRCMAEGIARPSLAHDLLLENTIDDPATFQHQVKWTTGAMYGAGGETACRSLFFPNILTFMMMMALNPDRQKLAQAEINKIIGTERLPGISDRPNLPYIEATIKEVMRWHPVLPLSIARMSTKDDIYNGYFIPKGTIVIPNVWAVAYDPNEKYDPNAFIPERFLDPNESIPDPTTYAFGFGRRVCPGKALAENSVFVIIAGMLAAFDILPPDDGELKPPALALTKGVCSYPERFSCRIIPRSQAAAELVLQRAAHCSV
ncbi:hypothetical protein Hypma_013169 [Hypsizygus marmoreus]|uniref:O-methylsterigmatocystin oxidoreductase n=1 Tax=Hypsizygus marmoreus TaxID=39966 RepID=A0A369JC64_HYPMA|nr:hypothetical protein Hypma_013169 [Hypsizygus marmoreus]